MESNNINTDNGSMEKIPQVKKHHYLGPAVFLAVMLLGHIFIFSQAKILGFNIYLVSGFFSSTVLTLFFILISTIIRKIAEKYGRKVSLFLWSVIVMLVVLGPLFVYFFMPWLLF